MSDRSLRHVTTDSERLKTMVKRKNHCFYNNLNKNILNFLVESVKLAG